MKNKKILQILLVVILCAVGATSYYIAQDIQPVIVAAVEKQTSLKNNRQKANDPGYAKWGIVDENEEIYSSSIYNDDNNAEGEVFVSVYVSDKDENKVRVLTEKHINSSWATGINGGGVSYDFLPEIKGEQLFPLYLEGIENHILRAPETFEIMNAYDFSSLTFPDTDGNGVALSEITANKLGIKERDTITIGENEYVVSKILTPTGQYESKTHNVFYQANIIELPFILFEKNVTDDSMINRNIPLHRDAMNRVFYTCFETREGAEKYLAELEELLGY